MSINSLIAYLPDGTLPFLKKWGAGHAIHIIITRNRRSKLGDYRLKKDGSHQITVNSTLEPQLFFFVLTHEIAHLLAFAKFGRRIAPHGQEWKTIYRGMLLDTLHIYDEELKPLIQQYSHVPKANFMASPELVSYFERHTLQADEHYIQDLEPEQEFVFRNSIYRMEGKIKKNYLCTNLASGRKYAFRPLARVIKKK